MADCEDGSGTGATEIASLPLLSGCPADAEFFLVGNAVGGKGTYKYARRRFGDINDCVGGGLPPLIGVVGGGTAKDPVAGISTFQHDDLIGLGSTNNGRIKIEIDNVIQSNFGINTSFHYDNDTGTIDLDIGNNAVWVTDSGLYIDLNQ